MADLCEGGSEPPGSLRHKDLRVYTHKTRNGRETTHGLDVQCEGKSELQIPIDFDDIISFFCEESTKEMFIIHNRRRRRRRRPPRGLGHELGRRAPGADPRGALSVTRIGQVVGRIMQRAQWGRNRKLWRRYQRVVSVADLWRYQWQYKEPRRIDNTDYCGVYTSFTTYGSNLVFLFLNYNFLLPLLHRCKSRFVNVEHSICCDTILIDSFFQQSRAVASWSKASCLGLALRNARCSESSCGKKFSHEISVSVWDRCPPSIVMQLGSYDRPYSCMYRNSLCGAIYRFSVRETSFPTRLTAVRSSEREVLRMPYDNEN
ncbi:hypothetical protein ANN_07044 [Periplaneta americana]|uniref:Uncharacterized protein n=1 Tax=Periplaneta americana TaxID=6978 RepID=A0ABQ8TF60_PERAM|nr:hypothetical protein ANN_07044 [Periplaneta americana]